LQKYGWKSSTISGNEFFTYREPESVEVIKLGGTLEFQQFLHRFIVTWLNSVFELLSFCRYPHLLLPDDKLEAALYNHGWMYDVSKFDGVDIDTLPPEECYISFYREEQPERR